MMNTGVHIFLSPQDMVEIKHQLALISFFYVVAFIAMMIDFRSGIQKAKRLGIARTSKGYRMTIVKINQYLMLMFLLTLIDIAKTLIGFLNIFGWKDMPWLTFVGAIIICLIELKSVWENAPKGNQEEVNEAVRGLLKLLKTKGDKDDVVSVLNKAFEDLEDDKSKGDESK